MKRDFVRQVFVYEDHFKEFRKSLDRGTLKKVYQVLTLIMSVKVIPQKFLKAIEGRHGLYEVRIEYVNNIYRIFCCFDKEDLIVLFNGFQKKSQKTPEEVLDKAETLMKKYFEEKQQRNNE